MSLELYVLFRIAIEIVTLIAMFLIPPYLVYAACKSLLQWGKDCDEAKASGITLDELYAKRTAMGDERVPKPLLDLPRWAKRLWEIPHRTSRPK